MDTLARKKLHRHLIWIYVGFFVTLATGVAHFIVLWGDQLAGEIPISPRMYYNPWLLLGAFVAKMACLVLVALMIDCLRRSVRRETPLPPRMIAYTRVVAVLIVAAAVLSATGMHPRGLFTLNYWDIFVALLVLFAAEAFSIGAQLGEEQKLTI